MHKYILWFWQFWRRYRIRMMGMILFTCVTIVIKTAFPVLLKTIIDELSGDYVPDHVVDLVLIFIGFALLHEFVSRFLPMSRFYFGALFTVDIRNKYFTEFTRKGERFFHKFSNGDLLTRLTDDIDGNWDRISWYSCSGILRPVEAVLVLVFTLSVMFAYSWKLTLVTFLPLPVLVYLMARFEHRLSSYTKAKQQAISTCNAVLESCFSGIRVVKTTLSESDQAAKYEDALQDRLQKEKDFLRINQLVHLFAMLVSDAGTIIVIFVGSLFLVGEQITLGTFLLFIIYLGRLIEPIWTLAFFYASSKQVFRYVDRLMETGDPELNMDEDNRTVRVGDFRSLEFREVSFGYELNGGRKILNDVSFRINKGEHLAVVGPVGSGKTTLLELVAANLNPQQGTILVNGTRTVNCVYTNLHKLIGYVTQESVLFSESIRDNLMLGDRFADAELEMALSLALMTDEVAQLPDRLETVLGQRGVTMSGGQKQRLSIARTLLRKPQLLLLDDCTAAMDARTEARFWESIHDHLPDTTIIMVTHRKASARQFPRKLMVADGVVRELRTDQELDLAFA